MKLLFAIPHFYNPEGGGRHGSLRKNPRPRITALTQCIYNLRYLYDSFPCWINHARGVASPAEGQGYKVDIIICTTGNFHLLSQIPLPSSFFEHCPTQAEPKLLGFECHRVLKENLGRYDYYCYLEDDLILHDPWFFIKLNWFTSQAGNGSVLQPNRYEHAIKGDRVWKCYVDGELRPDITARFQDIQQEYELAGTIMGEKISLRRTLNPHSGCFFLNAEQMEHWSSMPYFLDRDCSFIGPLESAATLGIMKTFRVYKPAPPYTSFLEIQHFGNGYLSLIPH
ncbi:MAG TPA: calcium-binding protein [Geminocystis sp. M7585_C2015_104]|nr:calcium-binding protein [Geminocystis sp. M7585_C2015_104]